ncbi:GMP synthase [glutamine-hydrolyzing] [Candidatus Ecksteinia adelgidicola]|nr:GMP synthase [glutamine-hydrolyzing] [Candidatus Ecksteinia adelgidicola]
MKKNIHKHLILVLDFGSQYSQLIARRVRAIGVYCELWNWNITEKEIKKLNPNGFILSGSPESTTNNNSPRAPEYVFNAGIPVLGVCYGMQTMAMQLGGSVQKSHHREFGYAQVKVIKKTKLLHDVDHMIDLSDNIFLDVWMSHGDKVISIPPNFVVAGSTKNCPFAIIVNEEKRFYGVQFHPEVTHTRQGTYILQRFIVNICHCKALWTPTSIVKNVIKYIRKKVGEENVIIGLSGGIDSSVTAMLMYQAIGSRITCVFVDNGLLRLNEINEIKKIFKNHFRFKIIYISAEKRFLTALIGIKDPESKRKIIGKLFIDIFNEEACKQKNIKWLAQGTIYSDIIESTTSSTISKAHVIKSHHNVGGLPNKMKLELIEPLKKLFKDEVQKIGLELGLSYDVLHRHPFPGPGLGIRILGEVKKEYCDLLCRADAIFIEELRKANLYNKISQAFAVFLPIKTVGVMGDARTYEWIIALRAVETIDFMTAQWAHLPYDFLDLVSHRIINEVRGISRVVYDISGKPPTTIEWE